jgi:hypothetical protein
MARLARLVYRMLKYGQQYVDEARTTTSRETANNKSSFVRKKAAQLGLQVTLAYP